MKVYSRKSPQTEDLYSESLPELPRMKEKAAKRALFPARRPPGSIPGVGNSFLFHLHDPIHTYSTYSILFTSTIILHVFFSFLSFSLETLPFPNFNPISFNQLSSHNPNSIVFKHIFALSTKYTPFPLFILRNNSID